MLPEEVRVVLSVTCLMHRCSLRRYVAVAWAMCTAAEPRVGIHGGAEAGGEAVNNSVTISVISKAADCQSDDTLYFQNNDSECVQV